MFGNVNYESPFGRKKPEVPLTRIPRAPSPAQETFNPVPFLGPQRGPFRGQGAHFQFGNRRGRATGGFTSKDNVPAMLMGGEYVVNKDTVNRYGKNFFDQLNSGRVRGYADGGLVGGTGGVGSGLSGDTNIAITVNVEGGANAVTTESSETEETRSGDQQAKEFTNSIKIAVLNEITKQKRPGGMLYKS